MALRIDLKPGESLSIGGVAVITLEEKSGKSARFSVQADKSVPIKRVEQPAAAHVAAKLGITGMQ